MRLLIRSAMIFFGILLATALLARGVPRSPAAQAGSGVLLELQGGWPAPSVAPPRR